MNKLPDKAKSIYPKTLENFKAILAYYFHPLKLEYGLSVEEIYTNLRHLSLNQMEFIAKCASQEIVYWRGTAAIPPTIESLMKLTEMALTQPEGEWRISANGKQRLKGFLECLASRE